jgi:hypothetical protein
VLVTEWYVCPAAMRGDDGSTIVATADGQLPAAGAGMVTTIAEIVTHLDPATPSESRIQNYFATPQSVDTPTLVAVAAPQTDHAALVTDGRCNQVPGSPIDSEITPAKLGLARAFVARYGVQSQRIVASQRKRNLIAAVADQFSRQRNRQRRWPLRFCMPDSRGVAACEVVNAADVP